MNVVEQDVSRRGRCLWTSISLASSLLLCGLTFWLVMDVWYAGPYDEVLHVQVPLLIFAIVDAVLALLTPWIALRGKKRRAVRWMDGLVVVGVRVVATVFCVAELFSARPRFLVFAVDRLEVVSAFEMTTPTPVRLRDLWRGPEMASLAIPLSDTAGRERALMSELSGASLAADSRYHQAYVHDAVVARARPLSELVSRYPERRRAMEALASRAGYKIDELRWLPMRTRFGFSTAVIAAHQPGLAIWMDWDPA